MTTILNFDRLVLGLLVPFFIEPWEGGGRGEVDVWHDGLLQRLCFFFLHVPLGVEGEPEQTDEPDEVWEE